MPASSTSRTCASIDARGAQVRDFLRQLLANDVAKLNAPGKALYSCMLNEDGGVIDDLIVYFLTRVLVPVVVNAGTRDKDLAWMRRHAPRRSASSSPSAPISR